MRRVLLSTLAVIVATSVAGAATCKTVRAKTWPEQTVAASYPGSNRVVKLWFQSANAAKASCDWGSLPPEARSLDTAVFDVNGYAGLPAKIKFEGGTATAGADTGRIQYYTSGCVASDGPANIPLGSLSKLVIPKSARYLVAMVTSNARLNVRVHLESAGKKCPKKRR